MNIYRFSIFKGIFNFLNNPLNATLFWCHSSDVLLVCLLFPVWTAGGAGWVWYVLLGSNWARASKEHFLGEGKKSASSAEAPRETGTELPAGIAPLSGCRRGKPSGATPSAGVAVGWSRGRRALKKHQGPEARWCRRPWNQWRSADRFIVTGCIPPTPLCFFVWGRLWVCRPRAEDALPGMHWGELAAGVWIRASTGKWQGPPYRVHERRVCVLFPHGV